MRYETYIDRERVNEVECWTVQKKKKKLDTDYPPGFCDSGLSMTRSGEFFSSFETRVSTKNCLLKAAYLKNKIKLKTLCNSII